MSGEKNARAKGWEGVPRGKNGWNRVEESNFKTKGGGSKGLEKKGYCFVNELGSKKRKKNQSAHKREGWVYLITKGKREE